MLHNDPSFSLYFGDTRKKIIPAKFSSLTHDELLQEEPFFSLKNRMQFKNIILLHQVHATQGISLTTQEQIKNLTHPFCHEGDFLITSLKNVALGVVTADCLPIIIYDSFNHVGTIIHAGWRGSIKQISIKALDRMQEFFSTKLDHVKIFFGPSAKVCCYKFGPEIITELENFPFGPEVIFQQNKEIFFDVPLFNRLQLEDYGVPKKAFRLNYNLCTICDESFCSYRREGPIKERQMTLISLK